MSEHASPSRNMLLLLTFLFGFALPTAVAAITRPIARHNGRQSGGLVRLCALVLALAALLAVPVSQVRAQLAISAWPMFHHDLQHTGRSPFTGPSVPDQKWAYELGYVFSSPAVGADGTIYAGSFDKKLYALNPDGTLQWSFDIGADPYSSPAVELDGTIYVVSSVTTDGLSATLHAVNPNGTLKWAFTLGGNSSSSPAVGADGTIYVGSFNSFSPGGFYAVNPDGTLKWSLDNTVVGNVQSSPAVGVDGTIYVGGEGLMAVNPDGTLQWSFDTGGVVISSPAVGADGTIYAADYLNNNLYAVNADGTLKWAFATADRIYFSSPAVGADGTIYVGATDGRLYAVNPNGTLKWTFDTGGSGIYYSSPMVGADGTIYVGERQLFAIRPDGTLKWSFGNQVTSPALGADGTIYVGANDGKLYAIGEGIDLGAPAALTLTPAAATNPVGTSHTVTATVTNAAANPVPGVVARFSVTGSVTASGSCTTAANGQCSFTYQGPVLPGTDAITAFADTNNNNAQDVSEPSGAATKMWLPISTPLCEITITNGGRITAANGDKATFGGNAKSSATGQTTGQEEYQDHGPVQPMNVKAINVQAIVCDGTTQASIYGQATINGVGPFYYRIKVQDLGELGVGRDTYWILLQNGYNSGEQTLQAGNVQIRRTQ